MKIYNLKLLHLFSNSLDVSDILKKPIYYVILMGEIHQWNHYMWHKNGIIFSTGEWQQQKCKLKCGLEYLKKKKWL